MLRKLFDVRSHRSPAEKAEAARRVQRIGLIVVGIGIALVFAELGLACALVPRLRAPAISIMSGGLCATMLVLVSLAFRYPSQHWPVWMVAIASMLAMPCLLALMAAS
jgi:hypothetical protein